MLLAGQLSCYSDCNVQSTGWTARQLQFKSRQVQVYYSLLNRPDLPDSQTAYYSLDTEGPHPNVILTINPHLTLK